MKLQTFVARDLRSARVFAQEAFGAHVVVEFAPKAKAAGSRRPSDPATKRCPALCVPGLERCDRPKGHRGPHRATASSTLTTRDR